MDMQHRLLSLVACLLLVGSSLPTQAAGGSNDVAVSPQEKQCMAKGWQRVVLQVGGIPRELLRKGPASAWSKGVILVLHGGGGQHVNWCAANVAMIEPQVRFSEMAVADGYAVFLLNSSDQVTDSEGLPC